MKRFISLLSAAALALSLAACSDNQSAVKSLASAGDVVYGLNYDIYSSDISVLDSAALPEDTNDYSNSVIAADSSSYNNFVDYIEDMNTDYKYDSYYMIPEALSLYEETEDFTVSEHPGMLEEITADKLMERVVVNNKAYSEKMDESYIGEFFEDFSEEELKQYCNMVVKSINYYIGTGEIKDVDRVKCILGDLKIFSKPTMTNAYVTEDNCLIVSPAMIETLEIKTLDEDQNVLVSVITHETIHMLQKGCSHYYEKIYNIGNSHKFEELEVNALFWNWFYEGAAEKLTVGAVGGNPLVYEFYINYINSLCLSVILDEDRGIFDIERSTLDRSLDSLFSLFGCRDAEDKNEIIKMLFSLDIIETDNEGFKNAYDADMTEDELVSVKRDLKNSICETMAKLFYNNLADLVHEKGIALNDIFYLISIFEYDVNSHIDFTNADKKAQAKPFIENYCELREEFFSMLSEGGRYSEAEITQMFDSYGFKNAEGKNNFDLSFLSSEKQLFLNYMLDATYSNVFRHIGK